MSPVLEIYSEHGLAEHDRGPQDYIRHSNGGRWTRNTLHEALKKGFGVGVIASSEDHYWYYVRATQANGQQAWSSPFWVEG